MIIQVSKFPLSSIPPVSNFVSTRLKSLHFNTPLGIFLHTRRLHSLSLSLSSLQQDSIPIVYSSKEHSFTINYLIDSCGLSVDEALLAFKYVNFSTPTKSDIVLSFFKKYDFPQTSISKIVRMYPRILLCNPVKTLLPKLDYLYSTGLSVTELVELITAEPSILKRSLDNVIIPAFSMLKDLFQSHNEVINMVKLYPFILSHTQYPHTIHVLREAGLSDSNISAFFSYQYRECKSTAENLREAMEEVKKFGLMPSSKKFVMAVRALSSMRKSTWEKKVEVFERWGWSKNDFLTAFQRFPSFIMSSESKINRVMEFFVNKIGFTSSVIACYPWMLKLSFEKRIIPRCLLYQVMLETGLFTSKRFLSSVTFLRPSDERFLGKMSDACEMEAPEILKLYQEIKDIMQGKRSFDFEQNDTSRIGSSLLQELLSDVTSCEKIEVFFPYLDGSE